MLDDFVKYMASLSEFERGQKMEILMNLFAPSPSHDDTRDYDSSYDYDDYEGDF